MKEDTSVPRHRLTGLVLLSVSLVALTCGAAAPQLPSGTRADKPDEKKDKTAAPVSPDLSPLPADAIIAIYEGTLKGLGSTPDAYLLKADRFERMQEELARLRRQVERPAAQSPTRLILKGKVDGNLVALQAVYEFETSKPGDVVRLGCSLAQATGVSMDGKTPRLLAGRSGGTAPAARGEEEGFFVVVDKPGEHQLTLDLLLALSARPGGQGFILDLPRAPITRLELDLPAGSRDVRLGTRPIQGSLLSQKGAQLIGNLGALDRLELDWKSAQAASAGAVLAARGQIHVRLDARDLTTTARLILEVVAGQVQQWQLALPKGASLAVDAADQPRVTGIDRVDRNRITLHTIRLKEPTTDPLTVTVSTRVPAPRPPSNKSTSIGPFNVLGTVRQVGSVLVSSSVADWHLEATPHADLTRRAATEEELARDPSLVAAFRYGPGNANRGGLSWLDLEAESVRGQLRTRLAHLLYLAPGEDKNGDEGLRWHVQTTLTVTPRWAGIERFRVRMPAGCEFDESTLALPDRVRTVNYDKASRQVEFRLVPGGADLAPITVTLEGTYPAAPARAPGRASLALPQPQGMLEKEGTIRVQVPASLELVAPEPERAGGLELLRQTTHELHWRCPRRTPDRIDVEWRPHRPAVHAASLVDLVLGRGQAQVRHELRYQMPSGGTVSPRLTFKVPAGVVPGSLRVRKGGQLVGDVVDGLARIAATEPGRPVLELSYRFEVPEATTSLLVPLLVPEGVTQGETKVRIWSEPDLLPLPPRDGWAEQNLEVVAGQDRLPVLVLLALRVDSPLRLRLAARQPSSQALIERVLARVEVEADGKQTYRVGYRLGRLAGGHLDFELPAPVATINLVARLAGKLVLPELLAAADERRDGRPVPRGTLVRLRLPREPVSRSAVLELSYQLPPDRLGRTPLTTTLAPPRPLGEAAGVPARWQITAPSGWVVLAPEPDPGSPIVWGLRGWLLAPRSKLTPADLEAWFAGDERPVPVEESAAAPTLVLWRDGTASVTLTHFPQKAWLVACSMVLVVLGLLLSRLGLSSLPGRWLWAWGMGAVLVLAGLVLVVITPSLANLIAYGCQPGLVVLIVLVGVQWMLHERYRRQIIFLPSFSRARTGSSLGRADSVPVGEPSTVDAPPRIGGSSVERRS
jgi:hypothetical protein